MKKHTARIGIAVILCLLVLSMGAFAGGEWKPKKPINLIVPWGPGGASDLSQNSSIRNGEATWPAHCNHQYTWRFRRNRDKGHV